MQIILKYLRERREEKLRKWCVEKVLKANVPGVDFLATVEWLFKWVSKGPI